MTAESTHNSAGFDHLSAEWALFCILLFGRLGLDFNFQFLMIQEELIRYFLPFDKHWITRPFGKYALILHAIGVDPAVVFVYPHN